MQMTVTAKIQLIVPSEYYELLIKRGEIYANDCNSKNTAYCTI